MADVVLGLLLTLWPLFWDLLEEYTCLDLNSFYREKLKKKDLHLHVSLSHYPSLLKNSQEISLCQSYFNPFHIY